jgi:hypothetical protein
MPIKKLPNSGYFSRKISNPAVSSEKDMGHVQPGERERLSSAAKPSLISDSSQRGQMSFPSPGGEGQGEGEPISYCIDAAKRTQETARIR